MSLKSEPSSKNIFLYTPLHSLPSPPPIHFISSTPTHYYIDERERSRKHADFERGQVSKVVHGIKQQLSHERSLKLDAFHQVDHLVQQVSKYYTVTFAFHQVDHLVQQVSMCNRWVSCAMWGK